MATVPPRDEGAARGSSKGRLTAIVGAVAALALLVGNVDKIWTTVSGWIGGKKDAQPPTIVFQISAETLAKAAAQATAVASAESSPASVGAAREAAREAANLKTAAASLKTPISLGAPSSPIPLWLAIAFKEIGQKEIEGPQHNPRILEYIASVYPSFTNQRDDLPWSTFFVNWTLAQAGELGTKSGAARSWLQWGTELKAPKPGAVAVFEWTGQPMAAAAHACLYVGDAGDQILCLSGNVANSVQISAMAKSRLLGYRWPKDV